MPVMVVALAVMGVRGVRVAVVVQVAGVLVDPRSRSSAWVTMRRTSQRPAFSWWMTKTKLSRAKKDWNKRSCLDWPASQVSSRPLIDV